MDSAGSKVILFKKSDFALLSKCKNKTSALSLSHAKGKKLSFGKGMQLKYSDIYL